MPPESHSVRLEGPLFEDSRLAEKVARRFLWLMAAHIEATVVPRMREHSPFRSGVLRPSIYVAFDASRLVVTIGIKRAAFCGVPLALSAGASPGVHEQRLALTLSPESGLRGRVQL